eukprot:TRINITY_DN10285_c0_g1_i1.p1 TRINITY_DN10285_c0_g1~~TRINITY_DN10285_c0_g1_i1.p1  ORF type:complete len:425 (-),score=83.36 TRINITY_DN10285_c0_g1_i1:124-1398(-)
MDLGAPAGQCRGCVETRRLARQLEELRVEGQATRSCLYGLGLLRPELFQAELHRQRFAAACRRAKANFARSDYKLVDVVPLFSERLVQYAGRDFIREASCASQCLREPLAAAITHWDRHASVRLFVAGGLGEHGRPLDTVECYDADSGTWSPLPPMSTRRMWCAATAGVGQVFVIGGLDRVDNFGLGGALSTVERLDVLTGTWSHLPNMGRSRCCAAAAFIMDRIYVMGGQDGQLGTATASAEYFDLAESRWSELPNMSAERTGAWAADFGQKVVVIHGRAWHALGTLTAEQYDPVTNRWSHLPPLTVPRSGLAIAMEAGKVYAVGGTELVTAAPDDGLLLVDRIDVAEGQSLQSLPSTRHAAQHVNAVVAGPRLFVLGGVREQRGLSAYIHDLSCFDESTGQWQALAPMSGGRIWPGIAGMKF